MCGRSCGLLRLDRSPFGESFPVNAILIFWSNYLKQFRKIPGAFEKCEFTEWIRALDHPSGTLGHGFVRPHHGAPHRQPGWGCRSSHSPVDMHEPGEIAESHQGPRGRHRKSLSRGLIIAAAGDAIESPGQTRVLESAVRFTPNPLECVLPSLVCCPAARRCGARWMVVAFAVTIRVVRSGFSVEVTVSSLKLLRFHCSTTRVLCFRHFKSPLTTERITHCSTVLVYIISKQVLFFSLE